MLNLKSFPSGDLSILCKNNIETVTLKTTANLLSWLQLTGIRIIDVWIVLSCELWAVQLDFFYPNGAMKSVAKSNLLNKIKIKWYLLPSLMRNPDLGATVINFMEISDLSLLLTVNSKDFLMQLMKFLQNSSQAFLNMKCQL